MHSKISDSAKTNMLFKTKSSLLKHPAVLARGVSNLFSCFIASIFVGQCVTIRHSTFWPNQGRKIDIVDHFEQR